MGAALFKPACGVETYNMPAAGVAASCGTINGVIVAVFASVLIAFAATQPKAEAKAEVVAETGGEGKAEKRDWARFGMWLAGSLALLLLALPLLFRWLNANAWEVDQQRVKGFMASGMSRQQAIGRLQRAELSRMQASATRDAGFSVASALRNK